MNPYLDAWRVPLADDAAAHWRKKHGVVAIFLNDVAAGVLIEIPDDWRPEVPRNEDAVKRVASGLRRLFQDLWHLDLVRPVLAVCHPGPHVTDDDMKHLRRLSWDDEWHRGDFSLRVASSRKDAESLLYTLMGDTMGELDENARADRVGIDEVREALKTRRSGPAITEPEGRLIERLLEELDRARVSAGEPRLVDVLNVWLESQGAGR